MENNNNENINDNFDYPENYEEIANLALLNFEKNSKIDLNKLIKKRIDSEEITLGENNNKKENNDIENKKNEWEEFESDDENEEEIIEYNKYQAFEDEIEDKNLNEEVNIKNDEINIKEKNEKIENKNVYSKIKSIEREDDDNNIKNSQNIKEEKDYFQIKKIEKIERKKLSNKEIKDKISKIAYNTPKWALNLTDQDFIKAVQKLINKK